MRIAFLHTAEAHVATFDAIFAELSPETELIHDVGEALLADARALGLEAVAEVVSDRLAALGDADAVVCSCTTLGPLADQMGAIRIDRPLMDSACRSGPRILVAICLESTVDATMSLLEETALDSGQKIESDLLLMPQHWPLFETGDVAGFNHALAHSISTHLSTKPADCVVLGQASMAGAADLLDSLGLPVLASPKLVAIHALSVAGAKRGTC